MYFLLYTAQEDFLRTILVIRAYTIGCAGFCFSYVPFVYTATVGKLRICLIKKAYTSGCACCVLVLYTEKKSFFVSVALKRLMREVVPIFISVHYCTMKVFFSI